jgi:hypothetical protein
MDLLRFVKASQIYRKVLTVKLDPEGVAPENII